MGHSAGLRAGTRVREKGALDEYQLASISSTLLLTLDSELTVTTVCLLARLQEEGYDQALNIPKTIQVGLCL